MTIAELLDKSNQDRNATLYNGTVKVRFMPKAHRYKVEGIEEWCPSVTSISGSADKSSFLIPWALREMSAHIRTYLEEKETISRDDLLMEIVEAEKASDKKRDQAALFGSAVHAYAEAFGKAKMARTELPTLPEDAPDEVILGIKAFTDWVVANPTLKFLATEQIVASKKYAYVGQLDAIVEIDGKRYIVDYKTSKGIYDEAIIQTSGYRQALEEELGESIDGRLILHFSKEDGNVTPLFVDQEPTDQEEDFKAFLAYLTAKRRMKILEKRNK